MTTSDEAAWTNAKNCSGQEERGLSSRHACCHGSGWRALKLCRNNDNWAAETKTNKQDEEIMQVMDRRSFKRRKMKVTDDELKSWIEEEEFEKTNSVAMLLMEADLDKNTASHKDQAMGSIPSMRPDGVFCGMSVQLNSMVTTKVKNWKAKQLLNVIRKYDVQFVGLREVVVNWRMAKSKHLLSLLPELCLIARSTITHITNENIALHQQGGVGIITMGNILNYYKKGQ